MALTPGAGANRLPDFKRTHTTAAEPKMQNRGLGRLVKMQLQQTRHNAAPADWHNAAPVYSEDHSPSETPLSQQIPCLLQEIFDGFRIGSVKRFDAFFPNGDKSGRLQHF